MSLLENLDERIWSAMEADKEKYPYSYQRVIDDIQNAEVVADLPVGTARKLLDYGEGVKMKFESRSFVLRLYQVFGR